MVLMLMATVAFGDVVREGPPCDATRCAKGEPVSYRSSYRDPNKPDTGASREDLEAMGFREVCDTGNGNYNTEVWCGPVRALPACEPDPKFAAGIDPRPHPPLCPNGSQGFSCAATAKCDPPDGFVAACQWIPEEGSAPDKMYCGPAALPPVPSETVPPSPGRCDTAGSVAGGLVGVGLLLGAIRRRRVSGVDEPRA